MLTFQWVLSGVVAVFGVMLNGDGTLLVMPNQVVECRGEGDHQSSYPDGKKQVKGKCQAGVYVGHWKAWHPNGEKMWEVDFEAGKPHGSYKSWWPNGQERVKASCENGLLQGKLKSWHPNGKEATDGDYRDGKRAGCWDTTSRMAATSRRAPTPRAPRSRPGCTGTSSARSGRRSTAARPPRAAACSCSN